MNHWNKKLEKTDKACGTIDTLIGARAEIVGDLVFSGGLRIDGRIKGNIRCAGDGTSMLIVSEQAVVTGDIDVPHMVVNGIIKGNVRALEHIELQEKAEIQGDVSYKSLQMALGARINGSLIHGGEAKAAGNHLKAVEPGRKPTEGLAG